MTSRIIVIGDSHLVPLKQLVDSVHNDVNSTFEFLPIRFLQSYSKNLDKCFSDNSIYFKKQLGSNLKQFYGSGGIIESEASSEVFQFPLEDSHVFLVGLGLGVDGLIRNFSGDNRLNKENCVQLPWYLSQLISSTSQIYGSHAVYPDKFIQYLMSLAIAQSYSFKVYSALRALNFNRIKIFPLPLVRLSSVCYYAQDSIDPSFQKNILKLIEGWYSLLCEKPDVVNIFDLVPIDYRESNFFLNETKSYSQSKTDIHMSSDACIPAYKLMISFQR